MNSGPEGLLDQYADLWHEATHHPFLDGVREGSLPAGAFERWLVQDYLYVLDLLPFQTRLLAHAPRPSQAVLAGGLVALEAELTWFEGLARDRDLALDVLLHPTANAYREMLLALEVESYTVGITGLWAIERAYLEAWRSAAPGHPDYREFVEHWTVPEFDAYVAGLETAAGEALQVSSDEEHGRAEEAFVNVARLERDFWEMAFAGEAE